MVYVPAGVPAGTETLPVVGFSVGTGAPPIDVAGVVTVVFTFAGTTATPFNMSLASALTTDGLPVAPFTFAGVSLVATIGAALTTIVAVAVEQLSGFRFSQIS